MTTYSLAARVILYTLSSFFAMVLLLFSFLFFGMVFSARMRTHPSLLHFPWCLVFDSLVVYSTGSASSTCDLRPLNTYIIILRSGDTLMMLDSLTT